MILIITIGCLLVFGVLSYMVYIENGKLSSPDSSIYFVVQDALEQKPLEWSVDGNELSLGDISINVIKYHYYYDNRLDTMERITIQVGDDVYKPDNFWKSTLITKSLKIIEINSIRKSIEKHAESEIKALKLQRDIFE